MLESHSDALSLSKRGATLDLKPIASALQCVKL